MKTIFIKDDRLREIEHDLNNKIVEMLISGKLKGSYTIKQSTKEFKTEKFPGYEILFGWEVTDHEDGWKIEENPDYCVKCIDVWLEKLERGWKIEDAPNEMIRKELRRRNESSTGKKDNITIS